MNLQAVKPQNIIAAAALLAPIALVQTVRLVFGGGPDHASAMAVGPVDPPTLATDPHAPATTAIAVTPKQQAAIEHLKAQRSEITIFTSPFNHMASRAAVLTQPTPGYVAPDTTGAKTPTIVIPPELRALSLGALMRNDHGTFAVISGRLRGVGDAIIPGWTITDIDPTGRQVTFTNQEGSTVILTHD